MPNIYLIILIKDTVKVEVETGKNYTCLLLKLNLITTNITDYFSCNKTRPTVGKTEIFTCLSIIMIYEKSFCLLKMLFVKHLNPVDRLFICQRSQDKTFWSLKMFYAKYDTSVAKGLTDRLKPTAPITILAT